MTTLTEEKAMAAPASRGSCSTHTPSKGYRTPAATGMGLMVYPKGQVGFWRMVRMVRLDRWMGPAASPR